MKIWKEPFGTTRKGEAVERWWLENKNGTKAAVLTYGATLQSLIYADTDIALGFDTMEGYEEQDAYVGAVIGRFANRIGAGQFTLNGKTVGNEYCDFVAVLRYEFDKSNSKFASLIKIKNDITSKLIRKGNVLLLVSYMLNSVIVFDTEKMNIQEARKWDGEISGIKELPCGFEIYSEGYPYKSTVKFNIEK